MSQRNNPYGQRAHEVRTGISRIEEDVSKTRNRECLIPVDADLTICTKETIGSHSIQRALLRKCLSRPRRTKILNFVPRASAVGDLLYEQFRGINPRQPIEEIASSEDTNYWEPKDISISEASVNPFACKLHDKVTFKPIEDSSVDFCSLEHLFLFAYRCLLYALTEVYNIKNFYESEIFMQNVSKIHPLNPEYRPNSKQERMWWKKSKNRILEFRQDNTNNPELIPILEKYNRQMCAVLINKDHSGLDYRVFDFSAPISIASSAFDAKSSVLVTVYPMNNIGDHKVLISWFKDNRTTVLTDRISEITRNTVPSIDSGLPLFLEQTLSGSYNVYASPDYTQKIPVDVQERILMTRQQNYDSIRRYVKVIGELVEIRENENRKNIHLNRVRRRRN